MKCNVKSCNYERLPGKSYCEVHNEIMRFTEDEKTRCAEFDCDKDFEFQLFGLRLCKEHYQKYYDIFNKTSNKMIEPVECEEPKCRARATKEWNGRNVCDDHYDEYRDQEHRRRADLDK